MMPALKDIAENPDFLNDPYIEKFRSTFDALNEVIALGTAIGMESGPTIQSGIIISQGVVEQMFQSIVLEGTPVEKAAQDAEKKLNDLFKSAGAFK